MKLKERFVLAPGTRVRVGFVDMYGFWGRDPHPSTDDAGRIGTIVGITERVAVGGAGFSPREMGHAPGEPMTDDEYCVYIVDFANNRRLEMVDHELVALP